MHLTRNRSIGWLSLALFAAVALFGQGLHWHPSVGFHGCCTENHQAVKATAVGCHGHAHAEGVACGAASLAEAPDDEAPSEPSDPHQHDCPVCHHFAQGQLSSHVVTVATDAAVERRLPVAAVAAPASIQLQPYAPRGPPLA